MSNATTVDRRDVAHPTNPLGGNPAIEEADLGRTADANSNIPPARSGMAGRRVDAGDASKTGGNRRIDPATHIPEPVKQDPGFARSFEKEKS